MKTKALIILILFNHVSVGTSSNLIVNNGTVSAISGVTTINCEGILINHATSTQCCAGNTCSNASNRNFENPTNKCPVIVLDGYKHTVSGDLQIIHDAKLIQAATNISNCRRPDNSFPTANGFNELNIATNNVFFGVAQLQLNVSEWAVYITSTDGDLICDGGVVYTNDLIFKNGLEQE